MGRSFLLFCVGCAVAFLQSCNHSPEKPRVLVFSKTQGYYHESIPAGLAAIQQLGVENGFEVDTTKNAAYFTEDSLQNYQAVVFLSTTQDVLDADQQVAFERYIQAGGGYAGIHAAADTEYNWPWYNKLVGAYFLSHPNNPNVRKAAVEVKDSTHMAMMGIPARWERDDEWYNYKSIYPEIKVLASLDESSYEGGENGENHPIAWHHEYDGGRAFYTGGGHTTESFSEPLFLKHILGGIQYAIGDGKAPDFSKSYSLYPPEENRFSKKILSNDLNEPMELAVAPDGRVFFIERAGKFYMYDPKTESTKLLYDFPVKAVDKYLNGLLGITIDPDFANNNFLYFFNTAEKNGQTQQHISRFKVGADGMLDLASEKVIIEIPIDLEVSAHTGGSMAWDKDRNLFISTGDNTVPFESDGFAPIDERKGRLIFDAQRSSANPNDLRGKILRIHPEPDGSYTIPEGNLFPKRTAGTRPEIYVMGCRNPYRISVDQATSTLYWGEVGPDSGKDGVQGPMGYDEINQARKAGNYGWPYFVANNKPYREYSFKTEKVGDFFEVASPFNDSPNNTGVKELPPAQKAMIWYPYKASEEFPLLGEGGRCAMGGPVYHFNPRSGSTTALPQYYDKALFIYDWMRNWVFAVRLNEKLEYESMEAFMPATGDFRRPVDMEIGPDGTMYVLEYGSLYGKDNVDARLVKIEYNKGNRAPIARISTNDSVGKAPLQVSFSSRESVDLDKDPLTYHWRFGKSGQSSKDANPTFTFKENGLHQTILTVTDKKGLSHSDTFRIVVGNTLPQLKILTGQNRTFYFDDQVLGYAVEVNDEEDQQIDPEKLIITFNFIPEMKDNKPVGHQQVDFNLGKSLMEGSDCKACHQLDKETVGPAFMEVAKRYKDDKNAVASLANKIITGGGGVWGDRAMNAHPQLSREDASEIVKYILALATQQEVKSLPQEGTVPLKEHLEKKKEGYYVLNATYTDFGGQAVPLQNQEMLVLRPARVQAEMADELKGMKRQSRSLAANESGAYFALRNIDLTGIQSLTYRYASMDQDMAVEIRLNSPDGPVVSSGDFAATGGWKNSREMNVQVKETSGKNDLYFVLKKKGNKPSEEKFIEIDWLEFKRTKAL